MSNEKPRVSSWNALVTSNPHNVNQLLAAMLEDTQDIESDPSRPRPQSRPKKHAAMGTPPRSANYATIANTHNAPSSCRTGQWIKSFQYKPGKY